jgi:hypothetical protein
MHEKLKSLLVNDTLFISILLLLVGVISFGLGRQSVVEGGPAPTAPATIIFSDVPLTPNSDSLAPDTAALTVVASRSGTKYHLPSCPGAAQIKAENIVYFDSIPLAEAAGYTPAANCPGLQ